MTTRSRRRKLSPIESQAIDLHRFRWGEPSTMNKFSRQSEEGSSKSSSIARPSSTAEVQQHRSTAPGAAATTTTTTRVPDTQQQQEERTMMEEMEESLRQIEEGLDFSNPLVTGELIMTTTTASSSSSSEQPLPAGPPAGGRAAFLSVGSALSSLRRRVDEFCEGHVTAALGPASEAPGCSTAASSSASSATASADASAVAVATAAASCQLGDWGRQFSARLSTAELAHSTRTPLHRISSALGRRDRPGSDGAPISSVTTPAEFVASRLASTTASAAGATAAAGRRAAPMLVEAGGGEEAKKNSLGTETSSPGSEQPLSLPTAQRRRTSTLHASRSKASLLERRDAEIHETGGAWATSSSSSPMRPSESSSSSSSSAAMPMVMAEDNDPVIDEIDEDDGDGDDLVDIEAEGEDQDMKPLAEENVCIDTAEPMEVEEEEPPPEDTPILLSESSQAKLDAPRRSVLFASASSHSFLTATATAAEVVGAKPLEAPAVLSGSAPAAAISVYSWGPGSAGSLHDDASDRTWDTARVSAASRLGRVEHVLSVSTSGSHSAVATPSGLLTCGLNDKGQVDPLCSASATTKGVVVNNSIPRPTLLESINVPVVQVSCGADHTAAVTSTGVVLTWGSNEYGQLGHPNRSSSLSLMSVAPSSSSSSGTTMIRPRDTFVRPQAMALSRKRAYSVACGDGFTVVLTTRMEVLCCGVQSIAGYETPARRLSFSMLSPGGATTAPAAAAGIPGSAASHHHPLPSTLPELECLPIVAIAAGRHHAAAVTAHGSVLAWGENTRGCCGRASPKVLHIPVPIRIPRLPGQEERTGCSSSGGGETDAGGGENPFPSDDSAVVHVACGDEHTVLLTRSGRALVCGSNEEGQLGVARDSDAVWYHVIPLTFGRKIVDARAGRAHTLLLDDEGDLWVLGDGNPTPKRLLHGEPVVAIAAGGSHSIAIASRPWPPIPPSAGMNREFSNLVAGSTRLDGPESIEELVRLVENAADPDDGGTGVESRDLAKRAEELMKTPAVLNSLFFEPRDLEDLFRKLISLRRLEDRQAMARAVEAGMKYALDAIKADNVRLICPESMRFLLLYMQCPLFVDCDVSEISFDVRSDVMIAICEVILGLSFEGYKAFISLVSMCYTRETFTKFLIRPLLRQLEKGLGAKAGPAERVVPLATGVLSWLHSASERAGGIARPEDFYSTAVNEMDSKDAFIDLYRWKKSSKVQRSKNFFLCAHPFLFSPESKRNLLQIENQMEMFNTATQDGVTYNVAEGIFEFDPYWVLEVEREQLLPQTLRKIADAKAKDLRKKLRIVFKGEEGVDAGGVTREFFQLISTQLFDVSSGLWLAPDQLEDEHITWFNPDCFWNDEGYYLVGILVGLAVYNNVLLDVNFPLAVYRKLLGLPLGIEDLPDRSVQKSLQELLDYEREDVEDVFCLNFAVDWVDLGRKRTVELKPGGLSIPVTADNKDDYVRLYVKWLLEESIHAQYDAFERGFMKIMQNSTLEFLSPEELELLVVGTRDLDFNALEANTEYEGGYDRNSEVIKHFWKFVKSSDSETQLKLLRFVTGSSKAPIGGLGKLSFKIQRAGPDSQQLPTSHTCFNTLLLNEYDSYDKLAAQLDRAIDECEGFGLQ